MSRPCPAAHADRRRRLARAGSTLAVALLALSTGAAIGAVPAGAVAAVDEGLATARDEGPIRFHVRRIPLQVGPAVEVDAVRIRVVLEHVGEEALDGLGLVISVHPAVDDRDALLAALREGPDTPALRQRRTEVRPLAPGDLVAVEVELPLDGLGLPGPDAEGDGSRVHPITLRLIDGTVEVARLDSAVVRMTGVPAAPLLASVVVPYTDAPWRSVGDAYPAGVSAPVRPGGRLDEVLTALEQRPQARVVLAPAAHLLEDLADRADGFTLREADGTLSAVPGDDAAALVAATTVDRLRRLVATLPLAPIAGPYADADLAAIARADPELVALAEAAATRGPERAQRVLGREVEPSATLAAPLDPLALELITGDVALIASDAVGAPDAELARRGSALRSVRTPSGRALAVLVADADVTRLMAEPSSAGGPLHAAHLVATLTALTHLAAPDVAGRTLLVLPPRDWAPAPVLVAELVARLDQAPWLRLDAPVAIARIGRGEPTTLRPITITARPLPDPLRLALLEARDELAALERALPASAVTTADGRTRTASGMRDELVLATSGWWTGVPRSPAQALVEDVLATSATAFADVELGLGDVTLTARDGLLPVTLTRTSGPAIDVIVELSGPAALTWPEGRRSAPLRLEPGVETTVALPTSTRSTGAFAVRVRVAEPEGVRTITTGTLSVRSTAASRPALLGIATLVAALLGGSYVRSRRRGPLSRPADGAA